jgi:hypothetical protein
MLQHRPMGNVGEVANGAIGSQETSSPGLGCPLRLHRIHIGHLDCLAVACSPNSNRYQVVQLPSKHLSKLSRSPLSDVQRKLIRSGSLMLQSSPATMSPVPLRS